MQILAYDKYNPVANLYNVTNCKSLDPIFETADIVSFHVPLQDDTIHYLNDAFIHQMRKPFILINTSRGAVVDIFSLRKGMENGKVTGTCLDVFEEEPIGSMTIPVRNILNEIMNLPNAVVTPHIAGYTFDALYKMSSILLEKIGHL